MRALELLLQRKRLVAALVGLLVTTTGLMTALRSVHRARRSG